MTWGMVFVVNAVGDGVLGALQRGFCLDKAWHTETNAAKCLQMMYNVDIHKQFAWARGSVVVDIQAIPGE